MPLMAELRRKRETMCNTIIVSYCPRLESHELLKRLYRKSRGQLRKRGFSIDLLSPPVLNLLMSV